jgi:hypothetical protein
MAMCNQYPAMTGTCYFVSEQAAVSYYVPYCGTRVDAALAVARKLRAGEIHVGKPQVLPGERLVLIDNRTRYAILGA